jgi:hypothetical protein
MRHRDSKGRCSITEQRGRDRLLGSLEHYKNFVTIKPKATNTRVRKILNVVLLKIKVAVGLALQDLAHSYRLTLCPKVLAI